MSRQDDSDKTEEPTARKLAQGREKGQVLSSKEVNNFAILLGATAGACLGFLWWNCAPIRPPLLVPRTRLGVPRGELGREIGELVWV